MRRLLGFIVCGTYMGECSRSSGAQLHCRGQFTANRGYQQECVRRFAGRISTYMNETKFSNAVFSPNEKIECRLFLTVAEYSDDRIKGELQLQLSRPVYNSTYTTTLFNFRDTKSRIRLQGGRPLIYNENTVDNNPHSDTRLLCQSFLAIDFDSFSPKGDSRSMTVPRA